MAEDEKVEWHHLFNGHKLGQSPGDGEGGLACCSPWDHKGLNSAVSLIGFDSWLGK